MKINIEINIIFVTKPNTMNLGNTLRKLRIDSGTTQQEISEYLKIDRRTYAKWEEGITEIKGTYIPKIAAFFKVNISDLYHQDKSAEKRHSNKAIVIVTDEDTVEKILHFLNKSSQLKSTVIFEKSSEKIK